MSDVPGTGKKPAICVVASAVIPYVASPSQHQMTATKYAVRYLHGIADKKSLLMLRPHDQSQAYADASWGAEPHFVRKSG